MRKTADTPGDPSPPLPGVGFGVGEMTGRHRFVVVASRLPVDRTEGPDGETDWRPSPGGLVSALEPVMCEARGVSNGWSGDAGPAPGPMAVIGLDLVGMSLSADQVRDYYEGFCNARCGRCITTSSPRPSFIAGGGMPSSRSTGRLRRPPR